MLQNYEWPKLFRIHVKGKRLLPSTFPRDVLEKPIITKNRKIVEKLFDNRREVAQIGGQGQPGSVGD